MTASGVVSWEAYPEYTDAERIARARRFCVHIRARRGCRMFREEPVPREVIEAALLAADSAPHGAPQQPWHFAAIHSPEAKSAIRIATEEQERDFIRLRAAPEERPWFETASWLIVVFAQRLAPAFYAGAIRANHFANESAGIATGLLLAALHEAGVATRAHRPDSGRLLNRICRRPDNERPLMIIAAGHPADSAGTQLRAFDRNALDQITSWL